MGTDSEYASAEQLTARPADAGYFAASGLAPKATLRKEAGMYDTPDGGEIEIRKVDGGGMYSIPVEQAGTTIKTGTDGAAYQVPLQHTDSEYASAEQLTARPADAGYFAASGLAPKATLRK